jgi:hypothetical protein
MKRIIFMIGALLLLFLVTQSVYAGSSPDYRIDWSNSLTGSGGQASSSAYQVNITVGQTVSRAAASPQYEVKMGYWIDFDALDFIFLPIAQKSP